MPNPTITKDQFKELGFRQSHLHMEDKDNVWSVHYVKNINPDYHFDEIEIKWFCGTERYSIYRQTKNLMNIPLFEGFLNSVDDYVYIGKLFDLSRFYEKE